MSAAVAIKYDAPPVLSCFLDSDAFVRCIIGPIGSGKSSVSVMEILRRAKEQKPSPDGIRRTRFAVIRNTYRQLKDTTRKTFEQWIPEALGKWHEQDFTFTMRFADVHCEVLFRALDRPEDVKKVLSLELTGAYFNELREIPQLVFDAIQGRVGRYPAVNQGGCTWFGVWGDTNPWHTQHWGYRLFASKPAGFELFEQPGGLEPGAENSENLPAGYYERLCSGKDQEWVDEYVHAKYPASDRGSVYGHLIAEMEKRGQLAAFEHGSDGVYINCDLGISDSFSMWWWRIGPGRGVDVIDHYEAHGRPLSHYFDTIENRGWALSKIWLPHDARARSLQTGVSVQDQFNTRFGASAVAIGPELSLADGLQANRWLLEQPTTRIHPRCSLVTGPEDIDGLSALREYKYEYDEAHRVYKKTPLHNWASHSADGFRYLSLVAKFSELVTRPAPEPVVIPPGPPRFSFPALSSIKAPRRGRL